MAVPMALSAIGIFASLIGTFFVKTGEEATQRSLLTSLRKGTYVASAIVAVGAYFLIDFVFKGQQFGLYLAVLSGLIAGNLIGYFTEYYTSDTYKPTQELAGASDTGPATIIISGLALGMKSTAIPVVIVGISIMCSFIVSVAMPPTMPACLG
jgi:K(+)-stimulated pyrophosphate-energized sodium pump